jgi:hypothetical protein
MVGTLRSAKREIMNRVGDERILGKSAFVEAMLQDDLLGLDKPTEYASRGWNLAGLIQVICLRYEVERSQLAMKGRMSNLFKARKIIAYFAISELGIASFEVEQILHVTQSGVSRLRSKGCQQSVVEGITLAGLEPMLLSH